jgi:hypothetical protein
MIITCICGTKFEHIQVTSKKKYCDKCNKHQKSLRSMICKRRRDAIESVEEEPNMKIVFQWDEASVLL